MQLFIKFKRYTTYKLFYSSVKCMSGDPVNDRAERHDF